MSYYDNVKDNVKNKSSGAGSNSGSAPSFDTLKEAAEETSENEDENEGDSTPIEVLEEGGLREQKSRKSTEDNNQNSDPASSGQRESSRAENVDTSGLESKLDRIIEQNDRMIEILESFGS